MTRGDTCIWDSLVVRSTQVPGEESKQYLFFNKWSPLAVGRGFDIVDDKTKELPGDKFARIEFPQIGAFPTPEKTKETKREVARLCFVYEDRSVDIAYHWNSRTLRTGSRQGSREAVGIFFYSVFTPSA